MFPNNYRGDSGDLFDDPASEHEPGLAYHQFKLEFEKAKENFSRFLGDVPVQWEPEIFEANTPFTSYLRIKQCFAVVNVRIHYFDRYLKPEFYQLFLSSLGKSVEIRLVTTTGKSGYGIKAVTPVSGLFRKEFSDYELIEVDPERIHDRNLRVDNQIFTLGPGVDRVGFALTNFGPSDVSSSAHSALDEIIAEGSVVHRS